MIDRSLGVAGLALGLIFGVLQYKLPELPSWVFYTGMASGCFLLGMSVALLLKNRTSETGPRDRAFLRLHSFGDTRVPDRLAQENIFRWYQLQLSFAPPGLPAGAAVFQVFFVSFEIDVKINTFRVRSPDVQLPYYEVKEFNQRYAIVTFQGQIPAGTVEFTAEL